MSAIVLLADKSGEAVPMPLLKRCAESLSHRGPDGFRHFSSGGIALLQQDFFLVPKMGRARAPGLEKKGVAVAFEGRLDNADTLGGRFGSRSHGPDLAAADIVRNVYLARGKAAFELLRGPLALVLVDTNKQRLYAYRTPLVGRTLYYHDSSSWLILASEESAILRHPEPSRDIDETWMSCYFSLTTPPGNQTPFSQIKELLPGELLEFKASRIAVTRNPPDIGRQGIRCRTDDQYAERFRELLVNSLLSCTRGIDKAGIMLSAGMDSFPLAALMARDPRITTGLTAYSWALPRFPEADESKPIREAAEEIGVPVEFIPGDELLPLDNIGNWPLSPNSPTSNIFRSLKSGCYRAARADGVRVLLNGNYGDNLYPHPSYRLVDALSCLQPAIFLGELGDIIQQSGMSGLLRDGAVRKFGSRLRRRNRTRMDPRPWLTSLARARSNVADTWPPESNEHPRPDQYRALLGRSIGLSINGELSHINRYGIEWVEPYLDWELVDFMLSVPAHATWRKRTTKYLARQAVRGIVPDSIRLRPRSGLLNTFFDYGFMEKRADFIRDTLFSAREEWSRYVDPVWMRSRLQNRSLNESEKIAVWQCVLYEMWLDRYFR